MGGGWINVCVEAYWTLKSLFTDVRSYGKHIDIPFLKEFLVEILFLPGFLPTSTEIDFDPLSGDSQYILSEHAIPFSKGTDLSAVRNPFRKEICSDFSKGTHLNAV